MKDIAVLNFESWSKKLNELSLENSRKNFKAMFSSWWDGIVTDPNLMMVPIDDHQVHRGDAVFEAIKVINKKIYLMDAHLDRLGRSAQAIFLKNPYAKENLKTILEQTLEASGLSDAILRLFLSRGPGSFSPSPYDTLGTQFYVVVTELQPVSDEKIKKGVRLSLSKVNPKEPWLAQIKSCNYLQNVLMKKEAVDLGVDFTVGVTRDGFITEGSTENLIIFTKDGLLLRPARERILKGTMMDRAFELSTEIKRIRDRQEQDFTLQDLLSAQEIMMVGTTLDVVSVTEFEGQKVGDGHPGPVAERLRALLVSDQLV